MKDQEGSSFGRLRAFFWPVHRDELKIFLPLLLIFFLISFNYNILRAAKDTLIVTARSSGAEAIPFIKVWAILPAAFLMTLLFTRLSNKFTIQKVFYLMMGLFLGFFFVFSFVLYPLQDSLHPNQLSDHLEKILPKGCYGLVAIFRNWTFTTFYVMSELWSTVIMSVLFWGFANEITSVKAAKRFYVLLSLGGNLSGILSGLTTTLISAGGEKFHFYQNGDLFGNSIVLLACVVLVTGIGAILVFQKLNTSIKLKENFKVNGSFQFKEESIENVKMSLRKNFAYLAKSKYLLCIAVIVITYNITINLNEVVWKDQVHQLYPNPNDFQAYMGKVLMAIGMMATIIALFSGSIIRNFSWSISAMIPPFILLVTGIGFFSFLMIQDLKIGAALFLFGNTPLAIGVFFGSLQNVLSRATKYTIFDTTKELSFIPLNRESKLKGKAAIDGIGSRVGKSGGALIYQCLLMTLGTISSTIPYVGLILIGVTGAWILAVKSLGKYFQEMMGEKVPNDPTFDPSKETTSTAEETPQKQEAPG